MRELNLNEANQVAGGIAPAVVVVAKGITAAGGIGGLLKGAYDFGRWMVR